eukprot:tig00020603_g11774.t1
MGILEKIKDIETEIARTQKNKATEFHLGLLKAKLARYRAQLIDPGSGGGKGKGEGFDVEKSGNARVALIGFPSVGKSTLLSKLTGTHSEAAAYEFTTLTCIPGVVEYKGARIQLLDLPGIIEGAAEGKGRGRQVIAVGRSADLILMMLDASKGDVQKRLLTHELETVGIRLNQSPPQIYYKPKKTGGVAVVSTCGPLTYLDERVITGILHEYKIHNAEVIVREDATVDQFIDVVEGNRQYIRFCAPRGEGRRGGGRRPGARGPSHLLPILCRSCLYCYNKRRAARAPRPPPRTAPPLPHPCPAPAPRPPSKARGPSPLPLSDARAGAGADTAGPAQIDTITIEEVDRIAHTPHSIVLSCNWDLNLDYLLAQIWEYLALVRIYTKKRGHPPDFSDCLILREVRPVPPPPPPPPFPRRPPPPPPPRGPPASARPPARPAPSLERAPPAAVCPLSAPPATAFDGALEGGAERGARSVGRGPTPARAQDKSGNTIEALCNMIHRDFIKNFKYALVWGRSVKHKPQRVGVSQVLEDEDVVQVVIDHKTKPPTSKPSK